MADHHSHKCAKHDREPSTDRDKDEIEEYQRCSRQIADSSRTIGCKNRGDRSNLSRWQLYSRVDSPRALKVTGQIRLELCGNVEAMDRLFGKGAYVGKGEPDHIRSFIVMVFFSQETGQPTAKGHISRLWSPVASDGLRPRVIPLHVHYGTDHGAAVRACRLTIDDLGALRGFPTPSIHRG